MILMNAFHYLSLLQGSYFLLTALWALVHIASFQKITGPKTDLWLVKTVAVILSVIGGTLLLATLRDQNVPEVMFLAVASALGLTTIDVIYVLKKVISPIYLADAVAELILVVAWVSVMAVHGIDW